MKNKSENFYYKLCRLAIPLSFEQLLGSAMEMIDSLMVSWIGMVSAVGSVSMFMVMANTITWGILSGTDIFAAQFFGKKDEKNLKKTMGLSLIMTLLNAFFWFIIFTFFKETIIRFYVQDDLIVQNALSYVSIAKYSLLMEALVFTFSHLYRSTGQADFTLKVSLFSSVLNILLNYGMIFILNLGVVGAAGATFLSHTVSLCIYIFYGIKTQPLFLGTLSEMFSFSWDFVKSVVHKVLPLMVNETLFGFGGMLLVKAISLLGTESLEAYYIGDQIASFFSFVIWGFGGSVQILLSHALGQGQRETALLMGKKALYLAGFFAIILGCMILMLSPFVTLLYHIQNPAVAILAKQMVWVFAFRIVFRFLNFTLFSILKSGGDAKIIPYLDSGIVFLVALPLAFISGHFLENAAWVYLISQSEQLVRLIFSLKRFAGHHWACDLTHIS